MPGVATLFTSYLRGDDAMAAAVDACLARHRLPRLPGDLGLTEEQFTRAVVEAPATRPDRYTVLEHLALDERGVSERVRAFVDAFDR